MKIAGCYLTNQYPAVGRLGCHVELTHAILDVWKSFTRGTSVDDWNVLDGRELLEIHFQVFGRWVNVVVTLRAKERGSVIWDI